MKRDQIDFRVTKAAAELSQRDDTRQRIISGYGAVFYNSADPATEYWLDVDFVERVDPKAFDRALKAADPDTVCSFNHNFDMLLGRKSAGTLRLSVDEMGLRYECDPPTSSVGAMVVESIERKDVSGASFAFGLRDQNLTTEMIDGREVLVRTILDVDLWELGPVVFPAYSASTAELSARSRDALECFRSRGTPTLDLRRRKLALRSLRQR